MLFQNIFGTYVYVKGAEKEYNTECFGTDGTPYSVHIRTECNESYTLTLTNMETLNKTVTNYEYGILKEEEYDYKGKTWYGKKKYNCKKRNVTDMTEYISEIKNNSIKVQKYGKTEVLIMYQYKASDGNKYSYKYATGVSGSDLNYTKITCVKSYKVRNDNENIIAYKNAIIDSNGDYYESGLSIGAAAAILAAYIVLSTTSLGLAAIIGILGASYTATGNSIRLLVNSYTKGKKAQVYYDAAKLSAI